MTVPQPAFVKEWLADGKILCYRVNQSHPAAVDQWFNDFSDEVNHWSEAQMYRCILDIRQLSTIVSAYALRRGTELTRMRPDLRGGTAILIRSRMAAQIISTFIRRAAGNRQRAIFVDELSAIQWLLDLSNFPTPKLR